MFETFWTCVTEPGAAGWQACVAANLTLGEQVMLGATGVIGLAVLYAFLIQARARDHRAHHHGGGDGGGWDFDCGGDGGGGD
ncbi:MAG: hypothetical protein AAFX00_05660 [Pseudomonadota bacterium]